MVIVVDFESEGIFVLEEFGEFFVGFFVEEDGFGLILVGVENVIKGEVIVGSEIDKVG